MKKKVVCFALTSALAATCCAAILTACGDKDENKGFDKTMVFHVDLTMSTAIGPLSTLCNPGTLTFEPNGDAKMNLTFTDSAIVMMDTMLGFRISDFVHEDTYELNEDKTVITYHSTRRSSETGELTFGDQDINIEYLADNSMKFTFDIGKAIPQTVLYFYSNEAMMPKPEEPEPEPEPETYDVSFDVGEGVTLEEGFTLPEKATYEEPKEITLPEAKFSKEGNVFRGWAANGKIYEYGENYLFQPKEKVTIDRDTQFIAVWSDSLHVTITKGADGKGNVGDMILPDTLYGKYVYLPANPYEYKDYSKGFAGWSDGKGKTVQPGGSYKVTEDVVFEPVWAEYIDVTFKANNDDATGWIVKAPIESSIILPDASFVGESGKGFSGWLKNNAGTAKKPGASEKITEATTYVAKIDTLVTISFETDDGSGNVPQSFQIGKGIYFVFPECELKKEGFAFNGWKKSNASATTSGTMPGQRTSVTANTTYIPDWRALRTVSFATGIQDKTIESVTTGETMKFNLPEMPYENGTSLFDGWTDGTKVYAAGASYAVPKDNDTTLTAVWRKRITVKFEGGNGATGLVENIESYESKSFVFPENDYVLAGKLFGGWTDGTQNYMPGDSYTLPGTLEGNELKFAAVWNEGTPFADYTVVFRAGQTSEEVYKDGDGKSVTLNNFFPGGSMTELVLRPDLTADFVVKSALAEKDFNTHNTAGNLGLTLEKFQETFSLEKKNISYDYKAETNKLILNLGGGETLELQLIKAAKDEKIGYDNVRFEYTLKNKIGAVEKLTFAAIDGNPVYLSETKTFTGAIPADAPSFANTKITLTVNADGTGKMKVSILTLNFIHQFTPDMKTVIWLGDEGDRLEGAVGQTEDGKMTLSVTLLGYTIIMTEQA